MDRLAAAPRPDFDRDPSPAGPAGPWPGARLYVGETAVEWLEAPGGWRSPVRPGAALVVLVSALAGSAEVIASGGRRTVRTGEVLLLARDEPATIVWSEGARGLLLHPPRVRLQVLAGAELGEPCRLAGVNVAITGAPVSPLRAALTAWAERAAADPTGLANSGRRGEAALLAVVVRALRQSGETAEIFPTARSVKRAIDYVRERRQQVCGLDELASAAGVTPATLRQNFRACLGVSVEVFVQNARLDWARERLVSGRESRSVADLAVEAGFSGAGVFSRAYRRRFGEIPSHTRARAVRART